MLCVVLALGLTGLAGLAGPGPDRPSQPASVLSEVDGQGARMAAAQDLLSSRAKAVLARNKSAWMATVDLPGSAFGRRQSLAYDNILKLPISDFSYDAVTSGAVTPGPVTSGPVTPGTVTPGTARPAPPIAGARAREAGPNEWVALVRGSYSLIGFDRTPRSFEATYTLVRRPAGWRITDDADGATTGQLWDLPGLKVLPSRSGIVIGNAPQERMREYAAIADDAVRRVSGLWGTDWNARVVVVTPSTAEEFTGLLGSSTDKDLDQAALTQVAAVTQGGITPDQRAQGDQIVINPIAFAALQPDGRRMVVTHELTHVAVRSSTTRAVPTWLSEGMADYVGYADLALPRDRVASDLLTLVRAGKGPESLPTAADFDPSRTEITTAYSGSWLAVSRLVDLYGQARVVAFYRAVAGGSTAYGAVQLDPDASARLAFPRSFGVTQPQFVEGWQRYLQTLARKRR